MIPRFLSALAFLLALAATQAYTAGTQDTTRVSAADTIRPVYGVLTGTVTDTTGEPIMGATVLVQGTSRGAITKADGSFKVLKIPPGTYTVRAKNIYHEDATMTITITANATVEQSFVLTPGISKGIIRCFNDPLTDPEQIGTIRVIPSQQLRSSPP